jgi:hypothetical protein
LNQTELINDMKTMKQTCLSLLALILPLGGFAADEHAHKQAGPNGGRLVTEVEPHLEFLVTEDKKVRITFIGEDDKPVPVKEQVVKVTTGERANPTKLSFVKDGDTLVSEQVLPEGKNNPTVLQVIPAKGGKPVFVRFRLNLADCPGCDYLEYACTCDHEH